MASLPFATIPRDITGDKELVILPRAAFDKLLEDRGVTEEDVLRWSREAKKLKKADRLTVLKSLRDLR